MVEISVGPFVSVVVVVPCCSTPEPGTELTPVAAVAASEDTLLTTDVAEIDDSISVE